MMRSTRLEVDLDSISHNFREARRMLDQGPRASNGESPRFAAVLKANAYGMGAIAVAGELIAAGVDMIAVACLPEAIELRRRYPDCELLVMGHTPSEYFPIAVRNRITLTIFDLEQACALSSAALSSAALSSAARPKRAKAHVKVDTGMNRLGLKPGAGTTAMLVRMAELPGIEIEGIFSHLALDTRESDEKQFSLFQRVVAEAEAAGLRFKLKHICDSIGFMRYPEYRLDMVRSGALLFGVKPRNTPLSDSADIRTPFALKTRISRLRRIEAGEGVGYDATFRAPAGGALIATLPIGYADGYPRCLSNKAEVIIRGVRAPVVGLICMDQLTVDASAVAGAAEGDEVLLLGGDSSGRGEAAASPGELASPGIGVLEVSDWANTNRNEIISAISRRVSRAYIKAGSVIAETDYILGEQGD